jgi:tripartite-type tricarboxylate transporter receptor subunit TctC
MSSRRLAPLVICCATVITSAGPAAAQSYPVRPIRVIVPYPPGGPNEVITRTIGEHVAKTLGQPLVVDNRAGAASIVGTELAARAAPDGYTLLMGTFAFAVTPSLHENLPYDALRDFAAVAMVASSLLVLVVQPDLPVASVKELIALARARPGELNYASSGGGSASNLGAVLFQSLTGVRMTSITYKGAAQSLSAVVAGEIQLTFNSIPPAMPHIKSGRLRVLAVSAAQRTAVLPDVPTIAEAGVPGYELDSWYGVLAPGRIPKTIVTKLHHVITAAVRAADTRERFTAVGLEPATMTPAEFARYIASEIEKWSRVVRQSGLRHD